MSRPVNWQLKVARPGRVEERALVEAKPPVIRGVVQAAVRAGQARVVRMRSSWPTAIPFMACCKTRIRFIAR